MNHTSNKTSTRLTGNCTVSSLINWLRTYSLQTPNVRHTNIFAFPSSKQQKELFHVDAETTTNHVGMRCVRASTRLLSRRFRVRNPKGPLRTYLLKLMKSVENAGQRLSTPLTSCILVGWHGMPLTT